MKSVNFSFSQPVFVLIAYLNRIKHMICSLMALELIKLGINFSVIKGYPKDMSHISTVQYVRLIRAMHYFSSVASKDINCERRWLTAPWPNLTVRCGSQSQGSVGQSPHPPSTYAGR
jgi:hypothetical protein